MNNEDWSTIDQMSDTDDPELDLQKEFVSWLHDHHPAAIKLAAASSQEAPFLSFSKYLEIGLCGLVWAVSWTESRSRRREGHNWKAPHPRWFAIESVLMGCTPVGYEGELEVLDISEPRRQGREAADWKRNPFESLEKQSPPELRSELRCQGFLCAEAVEIAESFADVLNAMFEFSVWYTNELSEHCDTIATGNVKRWIDSELTVSSRSINSLKNEADQASVMCRTATEATREASKAAANILEEALLQSRMQGRTMESIESARIHDYVTGDKDRHAFGVGDDLPGVL